MFICFWFDSGLSKLLRQAWAIRKNDYEIPVVFMTVMRPDAMIPRDEPALTLLTGCMGLSSVGASPNTFYAMMICVGKCEVTLLVVHKLIEAFLRLAFGVRFANDLSLTGVTTVATPESVQKDTCSICLSDFKDEPTKNVRRMTLCRHVFHAECLAPWLERSVSCPNGRCELF